MERQAGRAGMASHCHWGRWKAMTLSHLHLGGGFDECLVPYGLGTIATVFGAATCLDGQQGALLDLPGVEEHAVHRRGSIKQLQHGHLENLLDLVFRPVLAWEHQQHAPSTREAVVGVPRCPQLLFVPGLVPPAVLNVHPCIMWIRYIGEDRSYASHSKGHSRNMTTMDTRARLSLP